MAPILRTTKRPVWKWFVCTLLLILPVAWIAGEWSYGARVQPKGIHTVADHFQRFGPPQFVFEVQRDGTAYYEFSGYPDSRFPILALPSGAPAYIYDANGKFVDWCKDPGDAENYRKTWPRTSSIPLDIQAVQQRFQ